LKIATWNVNSLNVRLPHVLDWLETNPVEVLCLQELKLTDEKFPVAALKQAGYSAYFHGQKTYNGVALLVRDAENLTIEIVAKNNPHFADPQARLIAAKIGEVIVVSAYFPNGQALDSDKFVYKMAWLTALTPWLAELQQQAPVVLAGDFNITTDDLDVYDPVALQGTIHCSDQERAHLDALKALGLVDSFRVFAQAEKSYSWWDYRQAAFRRNMGLRIDYVYVDSRLTPHLSACEIDKGPRKWEQPSDHTPVIATLLF
jgi:exodeoxyribonuclease III